MTQHTPESFRCPDCGRVSYLVDDIANRYCGACHVFVDDFLREQPAKPNPESEPR